VLKFRSMALGAEALGRLSVGADSRVTRVGGFLRRYKIDELPQLINVLAGDMSLVGPRPEVPEYASVYPEQAEVWSIRPGITDPASIQFRNEAEILGSVADPGAYYRDVILPEKTRLYLQYVRSRSFLGDLGIIFATLWKVGRGPDDVPAAVDGISLPHRRNHRERT
jgi:lipopolysaccharide/colanic/teichoic acid biosynthesis glycosyltransferase